MIAVNDLRVQAGTFTLEGVSFEIPTNAYGILMGKTGCGKTTVLEAVCGLKQVLAGSIVLDGCDITHTKAAERGIGYVPQDVSLFSTMTVFDHLAFALRIRNWSKPDIDGRVHELAELLGIEELLERIPHGLSGGEGQRVALGRALAFHPSILCLDEPLSALDHDTRVEMCELLATVKRVTGVTVLHITHDRNEAARLADVSLEFVEGSIQQALVQK
jgi:ABC-type sugar transport system ATPase subunit